MAGVCLFFFCKIYLFFGCAQVCCCIAGLFFAVCRLLYRDGSSGCGARAPRLHELQ